VAKLQLCCMMQATTFVDERSDRRLCPKFTLRLYAVSRPILLCLLCFAPVKAAVFFVDSSSGAPTPPYSNWVHAATSIQDAIDLASDGDEVLVTNGVYAQGGSVAQDKLTNRVALVRALTLRSVNGPEHTVILGYRPPPGASADSAVRCVYLATGAVLDGFTLSSGGGRGWQADQLREQSGGGVWCKDLSAVVTNCVIVGNSVDYIGGGAYGGTLYNCRIEGNFAESEGGGAFGSVLFDCVIRTNAAGERGGGTSGADITRCQLIGNQAQSGGAVFLGTLSNCTLKANYATSGGAAFFATLNVCAITGNSADAGGGGYMAALNNCLVNHNTATQGAGAWFSQLVNCTVVSNSAADSGGGAFYCDLTNCIAFFNTAAKQGANWWGGTADHCCISPVPTDSNSNTAADPQLVDAWHVASTSPCRGRGNPLAVTGVDLDGEAWSSPPSIGCDEHVEPALVGPLAVSIGARQNSVLVGRPFELTGQVVGRATGLEWGFGDGVTLTNASYLVSHTWSHFGEFVVTLTAFNADHPAGVSTNLPITVMSVDPPRIELVGIEGPNLRLRFAGQTGAGYWIECTTNLSKPISWYALQSLTSTGGVIHITDTISTNTACFYRVRAQ